MSVNTDGQIHFFGWKEWGCTKVALPAGTWAGLELLLWWLSSRASNNKCSDLQGMGKLLLSSDLCLPALRRSTCNIFMQHIQAISYYDYEEGCSHSQFLLFEPQLFVKLTPHGAFTWPAHPTSAHEKIKDILVPKSSGSVKSLHILYLTVNKSGLPSWVWRIWSTWNLYNNKYHPVGKIIVLFSSIKMFSSLPSPRIEQQAAAFGTELAPRAARWHMHWLLSDIH